MGGNTWTRWGESCSSPTLGKGKPFSYSKYLIGNEWGTYEKKRKQLRRSKGTIKEVSRVSMNMQHELVRRR